jgi:chemosensory pili system protein ChpA (sensor histidine kinase/response regulator)
MTNKKVLVVEDDFDARQLIQSLLQLSGFEVVLATDGVEGLAQTREQVPDLVITDLSMPRLDGYSMIRELRSTEEFKNLPILALTSHGTNKALEAITAGASRALARPIQNDLLIAFVFDLLARADQKTASPQ